MSKYADIHRRSIENPTDFWAEAAEGIDWEQRWDRVLDDSNAPIYRWFSGGKLNTCYNAVDRHVEEGAPQALGVVDRTWLDGGHLGAEREHDRYPLIRDHVTGSRDGQPVAPGLNVRNARSARNAMGILNVICQNRDIVGLLPGLPGLADLDDDSLIRPRLNQPFPQGNPFPHDAHAPLHPTLDLWLRKKENLW